jgi:hypothetical protein
MVLCDAGPEVAVPPQAWVPLLARVQPVCRLCGLSSAELPAPLTAWRAKGGGGEHHDQHHGHHREAAGDGQQ